MSLKLSVKSLTGFTLLEIIRAKQKNKENKSLTGFTLLELLVVVAIIALLASVIVVGIIRARVDAQDEAVVANLTTLRSEAETHWIETGAYLDFCGLNCNTGSAVWQRICQEVHLQSGAIPSCYVLAKFFCAQSVLRGGGSHCVDSTGYAGGVNLFCDSLNATCVSD